MLLPLRSPGLHFLGTVPCTNMALSGIKEMGGNVIRVQQKLGISIRATDTERRVK